MSLTEGRMAGIGVVLKDLDGRFQRGARSRSSDAGSRSATIPSSIARLSSAEPSLPSYLYAPGGRETPDPHVFNFELRRRRSSSSSLHSPA